MILMHRCYIIHQIERTFKNKIPGVTPLGTITQNRAPPLKFLTPRLGDKKFGERGRMERQEGKKGRWKGEAKSERGIGRERDAEGGRRKE